MRSKFYTTSKCIVFFTALLFLANISFAQEYNWVTGGGSTDMFTFGFVDGERPSFMCTDDNGNLYTLAVVGDYNIKTDTFSLVKSHNAGASNTWNILLSSHDCKGNMRFAKLLESSSTNVPGGLVYNKGKIYVAGSLYDYGKRMGNDATFSEKYTFSFLSKFDTLGTYEWCKFVGRDTVTTLYGAYHSYNGGAFVAIDGQDNIHHFLTLKGGVEITSSVTSQWGNYDLKYDVNGNLLDVKRMQSVDSGYWIKNVEIDKATNKYYANLFYAVGSTTLSNSIVAAFNADGTQIWKDTLNPRAGIGDIKLLPGDGLYFVAHGYVQHGGVTIKSKNINGTAYPNNSIAVIGKLKESNGEVDWWYQMGCSTAILGFSELTILPDGSIGAIGTMAGDVVYQHPYNDTITTIQAEGWNPFYVNMDSTGLIIDWHQLHGSGFAEGGHTITLDKIGNVYVGGEVINEMRGGNAPQYTSNGGNSDYFIGKYGYDCNCTAPAFPNADFSYTVDTTTKQVNFTFTGANPADSVYWRLGEGAYSKLLTPTHIYSDTGTYVVCVKVHVPCGRKKICKEIKIPAPVSVSHIAGMPDVKIYPNPAQGVLYVEGVEVGTVIRLHNVVGKEVYAAPARANKQAIDISSFASGHYIITVTDKYGRRMSGRVLHPN